MDKIIVKNLLLSQTLGANQWELQESQPLLLSIVAYINFANSDLLTQSINYASLAKSAIAFTESHKRETLEHFATSLCTALLYFCIIIAMNIECRKLP
jgi:FolB domain-containing protein